MLNVVLGLFLLMVLHISLNIPRNIAETEKYLQNCLVLTPEILFIQMLHNVNLMKTTATLASNEETTNSLSITSNNRFSKLNGLNK